MILVISRFRVATGMEQEVEEAFLRRPLLVEGAPGSLGMEAFTHAGDLVSFYLVTRWRDASCYQAWLSSSEDRLSYDSLLRSLNFGAGDPDVTILERIADDATDWEEQALESVPLLAGYLQESRSVHYVVASLDGTIRTFNDATALHLKVPASQLAGLKLWSYLTEDDATRLWRQVHSGRRGPPEKLLINFVDAEHFPYTLECHLDVKPGCFTLIGELPQKEENVLREHLLQLNNQLAVLTRDNALKSKALEKSKSELEKALSDLNTSYWHMRKISEYLPICMQCHKVRTADAHWEDVADYLNKHSLFLTHSLCPPCYATMMEDVKRLNKETS